MPEQTPKRVITFMVILSVICATILSALASALGPAQTKAKELDRSKQMMIAAHVISHQGYFLLENDTPAKYAGNGLLEPGSKDDIATSEEAAEVYKKRFAPLLIDKEGNATTFEEAGLNESEYVSNFQKTGYYKEPLMLLYAILPNSSTETKPIGYVIPVNGFGLWDAIYGYLAIKPDGDTVIGTSWYEQKETPGLGANITEADWQSQFPGKLIFQQGVDGKTDFKSAPLGITVVKGKVNEVYGDSPKAKSAVDGMPGATLTGNGVTQAFKAVLAPYRPFFIKINEENK